MMLAEIPGLPRRAGGVLLHPTSLPGPHGIGELGPEASAWLDWLAEAGCKLWQILPLGPTGYADSPYQSFSAFAGNHLLISLEQLEERGLLERDSLTRSSPFPQDRVDYGEVIPWKESLLNRVAAQFQNLVTPEELTSFERFCNEQAYWLDDYALFMAIKRQHNGKSWTAWDSALRDRDPKALDDARTTLGSEVHAQKVRQFLFKEQWLAIKRAAAEREITILGDMPIFVAHDSADVWANPNLFHLDQEGMPTVIAGVPPDYFSATGQRWGNPLYHWDRMAELGFDWWVDRMREVLSYVDVVRLDHFRGFEAYWEIPGTEKTAIRGKWVPGPGRALLDRLREGLGGLPVIAEDLGVITEEVTALRNAYGLPGMKVMQFGLEAGPEDDFLPHLYEEGYVAYTGTHDNDTSRGWFEASPADVQAFTLEYLDSDGEDIVWDLIEALWSSAAAWTIVPLQDLLELGSEARMNYPSETHGNWQWRVRSGQIVPKLADRVRTLNHRCQRLG